jgi:hypothetical protein
VSATTVQAASRAPATRRVVHKHHALVRLSHWANVPLLLGLIATGLSIYWAAPVYLHPPDPVTRSTDYVADIGIWIVRHVPGAGPARDAGGWVYDSIGLGTFRLAEALRLHWLFAYLFMANGLLYVLGLALGTDTKPSCRLSDCAGSLADDPVLAGASSPRNRCAVRGLIRLSVRTTRCSKGTSRCRFSDARRRERPRMHKPIQLHWLERLFVNYNGARARTSWSWSLGVVRHSARRPRHRRWMDTFRSMIVGWSTAGAGHGRD